MPTYEQLFSINDFSSTTGSPVTIPVFNEDAFAHDDMAIFSAPGNANLRMKPAVLRPNGEPGFSNRTWALYENLGMGSCNRSKIELLHAQPRKSVRLNFRVLSMNAFANSPANIIVSIAF